MSLFVEVEQKSGGKIFVNLDSVEKIVPSADGKGCILHFNSSYLAVNESLKDFSSFSMKVVNAEEISTKVNKLKKAETTS